MTSQGSHARSILSRRVVAERLVGNKRFKSIFSFIGSMRTPSSVTRQQDKAGQIDSPSIDQNAPSSASGVNGLWLASCSPISATASCGLEWLSLMAGLKKLHGDKAYDRQSISQVTQQGGITPVILVGQIARKASVTTRKPYKGRNVIERCCCW